MHPHHQTTNLGSLYRESSFIKWSLTNIINFPCKNKKMLLKLGLIDTNIINKRMINQLLSRSHLKEIKPEGCSYPQRFPVSEYSFIACTESPCLELSTFGASHSEATWRNFRPASKHMLVLSKSSPFSCNKRGFEWEQQ